MSDRFHRPILERHLRSRRPNPRCARDVRRGESSHWTWYTGSAGWMYRAGLEGILGFRVHGASLVLTPCIPEKWPGFEIVFKYGSARYEILIDNPLGVSRGIARAQLNGETLPSGSQTRIPLVDDGNTHRVRL